MNGTRRSVLGAAGLLLAAPAFIPYALGQPIERYPDPAIQVLDPAVFVKEVVRCRIRLHL